METSKFARRKKSKWRRILGQIYHCFAQVGGSQSSKIPRRNLKASAAKRLRLRKRHGIAQHCTALDSSFGTKTASYPGLRLSWDQAECSTVQLVAACCSQVSQEDEPLARTKSVSSPVKCIVCIVSIHRWQTWQKDEKVNLQPRHGLPSATHEVYADLGRTLSQLSAGSGREAVPVSKSNPTSSNLQHFSLEEAKRYNGC